jgi:PAS domain S-box-containing protein
MKNKPHKENLSGLRERAEKVAGNPRPGAGLIFSAEQITQTLHELHVHQIELEMQNEELRRVQVELENSRARYFDLYDLAPVGYCTINEKGLITEANLTLADLLGETRSSLVKQPVSRFILPSDQDVYYNLCRQLQKKGASQICELRLNKSGGTTFWARLTVAACREPDGASVSRMVISDISNSVTYKEALQKNDAKLQMLFHILPIGLSILDKNHNIISSNPALTKILDLPDQKMNQNTIDRRTYIHTDGTPMKSDEFPSTRAAREKIPIENVEVGIVKNDGSTIWTSVSAVPTPFTEWDVVVSTIDITRRKQTEETLEKIRDGLETEVLERTAALRKAMETLAMEQKRFNDVLEILPAYIVLLAPDGRVKFANRFFTEHFTTLNGKWSFGHCKDDETSMELRQTFKPLVTLQPHHWEWKSPDSRNYEVHDFPFTDTDGSPLILEMGIDATDRKRIEAALIEANEMKLLGQLTSGVAHEVRNPLNGILAIMGALSKELSNDTRFQPYIRHMRNQVTRLSVLMDDLLTLGRPRREETMQKVSLPALVEKSLSNWLQTMQPAKPKIRFIKPDNDEKCTIVADCTSMTQVIVNLLENAFYHSAGGIEILVSVHVRPPDEVVLSVTDQGTGIPPDHLQKIFEPFFTTRKGGTGLGLSIVHRIIDNHHGSISVFNNTDRPGATFEVVLPCCSAPPETIGLV